jgi:phenylacetate-coenzyme A ligase PaaK-like adenylate-forming protein
MEGTPPVAELVDPGVRHGVPRWLAVLLGLGRQIWLRPLDWSIRGLGLRYGWIRALFEHCPPAILAMTGRMRAERAAWRAARRVPGYRRYLEERGISVAALVPAAIVDRLPETDKRTYIDRFGLVERCLDGRIPFRGTTIDESSGSTGTPYNWIRSETERHHAHRMISFFGRYCFGPEPLVTINGFSMGAWATGINMSIALNENGVVKSTGPDIGKILSTLRFLGPGYKYLITGYPPFVKHLLDEGERDGLDWSEYRMGALVGGEGMTEELRDALLERFDDVYSGYGATDIEIGMAGESAASVALRRIARARPDLRRVLFGDDPRLPMVFQYNPLFHYLEVNRQDEVLCTISRLDVLAPRVRYNVHDGGGLLTYRQADGVLRQFGLDLRTLGLERDTWGPRGQLRWEAPIKLPFLFVHGRSDATISVMGANLYPEDFETIIYRHRELSSRIHSFCLSVGADAGGTPRPHVALELDGADELGEAWRQDAERQIQAELRALNRDYATAVDEFPAAMVPVFEWCARGTGPFAEDEHRVKPRRIAR